MALMIRGARLFAAGVFSAVTAASGAQAQEASSGARPMPTMRAPK